MKTTEIKLKVEKGLGYWVRPITEEFNNILKESIHEAKVKKDFVKFKNNIGIEFNDIKEYGESKATEVCISKYIPNCVYHPFGEIDRIEKSSQCYVKKNHNIKQNRLHYDCLSSWNCVLQLLNNPKFVIIYTKVDNESIIEQEELEIRLKQEQLKSNIEVKEII
jgi:hypothetical protein